MKLFLIAGARPNFMKIAPLIHILDNHSTIKTTIIHTGQHYDKKMSTLFFDQLRIPEPKINLEVGSASHAVQTAKIMERFEKVCIDYIPDMVLVVGDVNSTIACSLVAKKLNIPVCHYEAGLRSGDRAMPEEINRLVTDAISDLYFTTCKDADNNLLREGIPAEKIFMVGNLMIDSLVNNLVRAENKNVKLHKINSNTHINFNDHFKSDKYAIMTFHRPSNIDDANTFRILIEQWLKISEKIPLIFPVHPRTLQNAKSFKLLKILSSAPHLHLIEPLGYLDFLAVMKDSLFIITDSGGIQEEATYLKIPCLTVRKNTERPITITEGSNRLVKPNKIIDNVNKILYGKIKMGHIPKYWDGKTAKRIVKILENTNHHN
jgi:UDP-N-acetylglucosamine 2-epimerase (non-hydrolysing)